MTGDRNEQLWLEKSARWHTWSFRLQASAIVLVVLSGTMDGGSQLSNGNPLGVLPALAGVVGIILGQRWPWVCVVLVGTAPLAETLLGAEPIGAWTMTAFAAFTLAARGSNSILIALIFAGADYLAMVWWTTWDLTGVISIVGPLCAIAAAFAGGALRGWVNYHQQMHERTRDALEARRIEADRRVGEERLRIARDLHDVLGHDITVLGLNLAKAEIVLPPDAAEAQRAVAAVRAGVQQLLKETQHVLRVLRMPADERSPVARVSVIADLIGSYRQLGMELDERIEIRDEPTDPAVSAAAYRLVQEGLNNAQRHGKGTATITVLSEHPELSVVIENCFPPRGASSQARTGLGLMGMRERIESAGGRLAVNENEGTFRLEGRMPLNGQSAS